DPRLRKSIQETSDYNYSLARAAGFDLRYLDDYFYGDYKDLGAVARFLDHWVTSERWTKEKVFPTRADARAFNSKLVLRVLNPIANIEQELHSIAKRAGLKDLVTSYFEPPETAAGAFELTSPEQTVASARVLKTDAKDYIVQIADANAV